MEIIILIMLGVIILSLLAFMAISRLKNHNWSKQPSEEGKFIDCHGSRLFYRVKGKAEPAVIMIHSVGGTSVEWWSTQNDISLQAKTISFERPGYGWSPASGTDATATQFSEKIDMILKFERVKKPVILVASGLSAVYARHYACTHPENVAGALFVNPVPVDYKHWISSLKEFEEYVTPEKLAKKRLRLARLGYYRLSSPLKDLPAENKYKKHLVACYNAPSTYQTLLKELSGLQSSFNEIRNAEGFPNIPLKILFSGDESLIREWEKNGIPQYTARQICRLYRILSMDNLYLSKKSEIFEIEGGGERIQLDKPHAVAEHLAGMVKILHH